MDVAEQKVREFRATILRTYTLIAIAAGGGMVAVYLALGLSALAGWCAVYAGSNVLLYMTACRGLLSPEVCGHLLQALLTAILAVSLHLGGAMIAPWVLIAPIAAFPVVGPAGGAIWAVVALMAALAGLQASAAAQALAPAVIWSSAYLTTAFAVFMFSRCNEDKIRVIARLSHTDSLTGTFNRQMFEELASNVFNRARRAGEPLALMMIDIDHFKRFNDRYGHVEGDRALAAVATALRNTARRATDLVFRYGGEEFCIVSTMLDDDAAARLAQAVLDAVRGLGIRHEDAERGRLTVSVGLVHVSRTDQETVEAMLRNADSALYVAKRGGRDRVAAVSADSDDDAVLDGEPVGT